jgi:hypothetical protein
LKIIDKPVSIAAVLDGKEQSFEEFLKAVVDVEKGIVAVDAEMHSDLEDMLIHSGSRQSDLWGINIYPSKNKNEEDFIEFTSFINIRPSQGNKSMEVLDSSLRRKIKNIINALLL